MTLEIGRVVITGWAMVAESGKKRAHGAEQLKRQMPSPNPVADSQVTDPSPATNQPSQIPSKRFITDQSPTPASELSPLTNISASQHTNRYVHTPACSIGMYIHILYIPKYMYICTTPYGVDRGRLSARVARGPGERPGVSRLATGVESGDCGSRPLRSLSA